MNKGLKEHMTNKKIFLRYICASLEILCQVIHPFHKFEIFLTGTHCNLANLSAAMDEKYDLGIWTYFKKEERYYKDYPTIGYYR